MARWRAILARQHREDQRLRVQRWVALPERPLHRWLVVAVEHLRGEVRAVRPDDGACLGIGPHRAEDVVVAGDLLEDGPPQERLEVDDPLAPVVEPQEHRPVPDHLDRNDIDHRRRA